MMIHDFENANTYFVTQSVCKAYVYASRTALVALQIKEEVRRRFWELDQMDILFVRDALRREKMKSGIYTAIS